MYEVNLDRFAQGLPDAQAGLEVFVAHCQCGCGEAIMQGYDHVNYDGEWFYDTDCFMQYMGAVSMVVWVDE